jgi:heme exporter protein D
MNGKTKEIIKQEPIKPSYPLVDSLKGINQRLINSNILKSHFFVFICGGLLGTLFFIYIFGAAILDFTYTDWIMRGFWDTSVHYLGWKLFRNSAWYFPIGLMDNVVYPFKISMLYSDSIPLFAIIFKLFSFVLPANFQYFGLFGIVCYILQGGIGALIVRKIGGNTVQSIIGSLFFTLSTILMLRFGFHPALCGHFIILLCILAYLENNNYSLKKQIFIWGGLLALSASIHLYFIPMIIIFLFFYLIREYTITKNIKNQIIVFGASLFILIATMFCLGAFSFVEVKDASAEGLGVYSANLNSFINPQPFTLNISDMPLVTEGISRFIKNMLVATGGQYEGYAYLGLGIILLFTVVIFQLFQRNRSVLKTIKKQSALLIIGILLSFLIFSLSPTVTFNQYKLFTYPVIKPVERLWATFRCTGRMTWPIVYIIMIFCIWRAIKQFSVKKSILVLSVFLLIQWADLKPWYVSKGNNYKTKVTWQSELPSPVWNGLANKYKHFFFMGDYATFWNYKFLSFLNLAGDHKITVNDAFLARKNSEMINDNKQKEAKYLLEHGPKNDMVYVFQDINQASLYKDTGIYFYNIDDVIIGIDSKHLP